MIVFVDRNNIETDNLLMGLYMGSNLQYTYDIYEKFDFKIDKELEKFFKYIDGSNKLDGIMLGKLFKQFTIKGREITLFSFIIGWTENYGKSFDEFLSYFENVNEDVILNKIYIKLLKFQKDIEDIDIPKEKVKIGINDILQILVNLEAEAEFKWNLIEVCYDIKGFFCKCSEFFKQSREILDKKLAPFNERGRIWGEKLKEKIEKEGLAFVKEILEDFNEEEYENIFIAPRIMDNYAFDCSKSLDTKDVYLYFGENVEVLRKIYGKENEKIWVQNVIKYLADGSRYKIMKLLKEKPRYSGELAESLGISNATISHHTNLLFLVKLLEETKINNRNYMKTREDSIDKFLKAFKKDFNLEEGEGA